MHLRELGCRLSGLAWLLGGSLILGSVQSHAGPVLRNDNPVGFFTNAAIRLLIKAGYTIGAPTSTSNLLVTNIVSGVPITSLQIPIWPNNFYTPSVHRLLQLAANLYDATTNRTDAGYPSNYPYLPTVFRPVFSSGLASGKGGSQICIVDYREVTPADTSAFLSDVRPRDLSDASDRALLKPLDMVYNVPLVIGAKKGLPSFDEFTSDTQVQVARKLICHRANNSTDPRVPINEIDPAYYLTVTNVVGLQAWNWYAANYNRAGTLEAWPDMEVLVTNLETGAQLNPPDYPSRLPATVSPLLYTVWPGFNAIFPSSSFITPLGLGGTPTTNYVFLPTNSVYSSNQQKFLVNGTPDSTPGNTNWHVPHFQITVKTRLRFALVDQQSQRLIDYVNLSASQTADITTNLADGGCGTSYAPIYSRGGMWCTNTAPSYPGSFGVRLQIDASAGRVQSPDWNSSLPDPLYGRDKDKGVNRFLFQFGYGTQPYPGEPAFVGLSAFTAPYSPFRNMHLAILWQANDPLVHYTVGDLQNLTDLPTSVYLDNTAPPLPPTAFGQPNRHYEPWGGRPYAGSTVPPYDYRFKDPVAGQVGNSDYWNFPTNQPVSATWLGRVHRGTPWQTVYLKSAALDYPSWIKWSGNSNVVINYGQLARSMPQWVSATNLVMGVMNIFQWTYDSAFTHPTNDWRLASMLVSLLSTNDPRQLLSANQSSASAWLGALDGMVVLTNSAGLSPPTSFVMSFNSPQAATVASAILANRASQPNQTFRDVGDVLSTPELSVASPWLDTSTISQFFYSYYGISDEAYEAIPSQLLPLLRADSVGYAIQNGGSLQFQFSGSDGLAYAVQVSSDLVNWTSVSTNCPVDGIFSFLDVPSAEAPRRFYRSALLR